MDQVARCWSQKSESVGMWLNVAQMFHDLLTYRFMSDGALNYQMELQQTVEKQQSTVAPSVTEVSCLIHKGLVKVWVQVFIPSK